MGNQGAEVSGKVEDPPSLGLEGRKCGEEGGWGRRQGVYNKVAAGQQEELPADRRPGVSGRGSCGRWREGAQPSPDQREKEQCVCAPQRGTRIPGHMGRGSRF